MYCVKCGVRLQEGVDRCPLCDTPVWDPEGAKAAEPTFSDRYPAPLKSRRYPIMAFLTALMAAICLSSLIYCLTKYHAVSWSGFVMLACALVYFAGTFPFWFKRREPLIFVPLAFALACGYLLYVCLKTGGHWFLPFAFPVTGMAFIVTYLGAGIALLRFKPRTKLRLIGLLFILTGGFTMLLEFFLHITFKVRMFNWSLYSAGFFGLLGAFLFASSLIRPLRRAMYKKLFI